MCWVIKVSWMAELMGVGACQPVKEEVVSFGFESCVL